MADPVSVIGLLSGILSIFGGGSSKKKKRARKAKAEADARRIKDLERQLDKTKPRLPTTDVLPDDFIGFNERNDPPPPPKSDVFAEIFKPFTVPIAGAVGTATGEASIIARVLGGVRAVASAGLAGPAGIIGTVGAAVVISQAERAKRIVRDLGKLEEKRAAKEAAAELSRRNSEGKITRRILEGEVIPRGSGPVGPPRVPRGGPLIRKPPTPEAPVIFRDPPIIKTPIPTVKTGPPAPAAKSPVVTRSGKTFIDPAALAVLGALGGLAILKATKSKKRKKPLTVPKSVPIPLTPPTPITPPTQAVFPSPFSGAPPARTPTSSSQCQNVLRRRRRKGKCREGFFEERSGSTKFVTWRTVDCVTRKSIPKTRKSNARNSKGSINSRKRS